MEKELLIALGTDDGEKDGKGIANSSWHGRW